MSLADAKSDARVQGGLQIQFEWETVSPPINDEIRVDARVMLLSDDTIPTTLDYF